jgi:hypothetical protein
MIAAFEFHLKAETEWQETEMSGWFDRPSFSGDCHLEHSPAKLEQELGERMTAASGRLVMHERSHSSRCSVSSRVAAVPKPMMRTCNCGCMNRNTDLLSLYSKLIITFSERKRCERRGNSLFSSRKLVRSERLVSSSQKTRKKRK